MAIDTGKILRTSDKDYFNLTGENRSDYRLSKIRVYVGKPNSVEERFANDVPDETEVVVSYKEKWESMYCICARGTALIPKKSK